MRRLAAPLQQAGYAKVGAGLPWEAEPARAWTGSRRLPSILTE